MAQWSHGDRTLYAKLVYYGPAFGGKTTNLVSLHRITDPRGKQQLLTLQTVNDRTLFFDLLPFDLGDILGYHVAVKIYTVPGQVRYDTTRQVVLAGADAIVFVADSSTDRKDQNVWSLQNLRMNMRAKRLDPAKIPVLFQFNKQDLPCAAPVRDVAGWLGLSSGQGIPAVAVEGSGVLETFIAASKLMLQGLVAAADDRTRREIDASELSDQLERAFEPHLARRAGESGRCASEQSPQGGAHPPVALEGDALLERSVETSVRLGERLTTETARVARLEREIEAFRQLSDALHSVGASFDRARITDVSLEVVQRTLEVPVVSLICETAPGRSETRGVRGRSTDPLGATDSGQRTLQRMLAASEPVRVEDAAGESAADESLRTAAGAPLAVGSERAVLVAYASQPDGGFSQRDTRFLGIVASHLAAGLEKARLHRQIALHRDDLEATVAARTEQLSAAYASLRHMEAVKDRFLGNLSHEMKTPLTAILSAAQAIRDYKSNAKQRRDLTDGIVASAEKLERQLDDLFRSVHLERDDGPVRPSEGVPEALIQRAIQISGHSGVQYELTELPGPAVFDAELLARALANLIDNAVKFSPPDSPVEVVLRPAALGSGGERVEAMAISVLDRGCGVAANERERIFAPFEQGGDPLSSKPQGIGLGLHEARTVARRHGGRVECVERQDGGSEFRLTVPSSPCQKSSLQQAVESAREVTRV